MLPRFFAPDASRQSGDALVRLPDDESTHLVRVLRLGAGAEVRVFDGEGHEWVAEVVHAERQHTVVRLVTPAHPAAEPALRILLVLAVLKGDKMDDVVRDAVMMGVTAIRPVVTERTEISLPALARGNRRERWHRIAVSSAKQCGRAVVPPTAPAMAFDDWLQSEESREALMLVEPGVGDDARPLRHVPRRETVTLIVGPEGGWSEREVREAGERGITRVALGKITLRADATPVVALAALRALWGDL